MVKDRLLKEWKKLKADIGASNYVLAVSGGIDSVVLAHLFKEAGTRFSIAHCNFKLRGDQSDKDEQFVKDLAAYLGVDFFHRTFNTSGYASENGISIQMAARELRYGWFEELTNSQEACLVTAHHANDVVETMLFNLANGTGLAGLHGIKEFDGKTVRPLLWATKEELLVFARELKIEWREDLSNADNKYSRNRIRNKVIPELEKINPSFIKAAGRTADRITDAEAALDFLIEQQNLLRMEEGRHFIDKKKLLALPGNSTILYRLVNDFGFNYDQVEDILNSLNSVGARFSTKNWILNIDRAELIISKLQARENRTIKLSLDAESISFNSKTLRCKIIDREEYKISNDKRIAALDMNKISFPLSIRSYEQGDRFQPLGMQGTKLVSDLLIDEKVPLALKEDEFVVTSGEDIVWLVGRRIDDRFKITEETDKVFELRLENT